MTYALFDGTTFKSFFVGFEDLWTDGGSDYDYNDLIVEIKVNSLAAPVPLPTASMMGVAMLGGLAFKRIRRVSL